MSMSYKRFAAMIATSTVVMFLLLYLNTYALEHVLFSETRLSMAILMGAAMAVVMLGFMFAMYPSKRANAGIFAGGARSDEHTSELQSLMRISYTLFCLKKKKDYARHNLQYKQNQTS